MTAALSVCAADLLESDALSCKRGALPREECEQCRALVTGAGNLVVVHRLKVWRVFPQPQFGRWLCALLGARAAAMAALAVDRWPEATYPN